MTAASIRYELMTTAGLRTVIGDHVVIPNDAGATFGIHMERHAPHGHPEKWAVTHLASGMAAGVGPTRDAAIAHAAANLERNKRRLRDMLDEAMTARANLQIAVHRIQQNEHAILGRIPA
ncbi:hypothetical protein Y037_2019 [Burkholderia pseudomallei MSHR983]|uniref:hypothetical protein n=1 Tax=Burkholderia pseudomallei TaxID=28450 RepID=UPI000536C862|nr:hypothetical protein [Burkholderia pseudomallei]KGU63606.1 hypothetical protein Y037_2019 [Burkholderia pseudomallei MSHR983]KGU73351.1 hypothetical protein X883_375 [Burkholderia pseudomallei MSHR4304]KGV30789.1 hypothetical protein X884_5165 [Burkholderia pseudomallei MSHR4308]KIX42568.1 hypothetical protein SY87_22600 [Burkholderia pseudomallei]OMW67184.1 hypothetical protein AQ811_17575 [Burkholderia pseudomallei]